MQWKINMEVLKSTWNMIEDLFSFQYLENAWRSIDDKQLWVSWLRHDTLLEANSLLDFLKIWLSVKIYIDYGNYKINSRADRKTQNKRRHRKDLFSIKKEFKIKIFKISFQKFWCLVTFCERNCAENLSAPLRWKK